METEEERLRNPHPHPSHSARQTRVWIGRVGSDEALRSCPSWLLYPHMHCEGGARTGRADFEPCVVNDTVGGPGYCTSLHQQPIQTDAAAVVFPAVHRQKVPASLGGKRLHLEVPGSAHHNGAALAIAVRVWPAGGSEAAPVAGATAGAHLEGGRESWPQIRICSQKVLRNTSGVELDSSLSLAEYAPGGNGAGAGGASADSNPHIAHKLSTQH